MRKRAFVGVALLVLMILLGATVVNATVGDLDDDTVKDEFDVCADTPSGETIVNPTENIDYAGCTCKQVKELVDSECIIICREDLLEIREGPAGETVECPENYCDGTTLMKFLPNGYGSCEKGHYTPRDCGPERIEQALDCVGPHVEEDGYKELPVLEGSAKTFDLDGALAQYVFDEKLNYGQTGKVALLVLFEKNSNITVFNVSLKGGIAEIIHQEENFGEDREAGLFYYVEWPQRAGVPGTHKLTLHFSTIQNGERREANQVISYETYRIPLDISKGIVGYDFQQHQARALSAEEENYVGGIFALAQERGAKTAGIEGIEKALSNAKVEKNVVAGAETTLYEISITPKPRTALQMVTIIEEISKEAAEDLSHVTFSEEPTLVLEEDPLIMWHFEEVDKRVDLSYEVDRPVGVTGNTIVTASDVVRAETPWQIIIPMLLIPLIAVLLIVLPQARSKD